MGSKAAPKRKQPSLSPEASDSASSEASSSRSAMEVEEVTTVENSDQGHASNAASDDEEDDTDSASDSEDDAPQQPAIDTAKARTKLHHVAKTLRATAKKSKTFELQKLVKKLKGLQKKPSLADQAKLAEQELAALKSIDIPLLAGRALITKMVKAKLLPRQPADDADEDEHLYLQMVKEEELLGEAVLSDPVSATGDKALERAKAKITSSKVLADEVGRFVDELKKLAGIEPAVSKKKEPEIDAKGKGKAKQVEEDEEEREWSGSEEEDDSEDDEPRRAALVDDDEDEDEEDGDEEELMRIGREKMKALGDLSQWDDMIGTDSGAESGSEDEEPPRRKRKSRESSDESSDGASSDEDDDSDTSDSESDSNSDSDSDTSSTSSSRPRKRKAKSSSTFLPSLSTGFIAGRSDDEWSDAEADLADRDLSELKSGKKERKNRMGQRARKALYEKKYGSNANHVKLREERKRAKLERAAPAAGGGGGGGRQRPPAFQAPVKKDGGWGKPVAPLPRQPKRVISAPPATPQVGGAPKAPPAPAAAAAAAPAKAQEMHPSWIAKQKQKELMAQVKPQGKKVVFD